MMHAHECACLCVLWKTYNIGHVWEYTHRLDGRVLFVWCVPTALTINNGYRVTVKPKTALFQLCCKDIYDVA